MGTVLAERSRVAAVRSYGLLDAPRPAVLDELTRMAGTLLGTPVALITLVDEDRQWFAGNTGLALDQTGRDLSFCAHTLGPRRPLTVEDARTDPRFAGNALVTGPPHIRSYAGAPLVDEDGHALGAVCAIDVEPREFSDRERDALHLLAGQAAGQLSAIRSRLRLLETGDALARALRREEDLVATISHELRTPVAAIQGNIELLADSLPDDAAHAPLLDPIRRNGDRLMRMVDHLLDGTRTPAVAPTRPAPATMATILTAALTGTHGLATGRRTTITATGTGDTLVPGSDPARLVQAVEQLIRNAVLFSPPGAEVRITTRDRKLDITDTGAGIPADELPRVTERFFRGRHAHKQAVPGMGLGLTIAAGIAAAHGGSLQILSAGVGAGTTARLAL